MNVYLFVACLLLLRTIVVCFVPNIHFFVLFFVLSQQVNRENSFFQAECNNDNDMTHVVFLYGLFIKIFVKKDAN